MKSDKVKTDETLSIVETVLGQEKAIAKGIDVISKAEQRRSEVLTRRADRKKKTIDANLLKQLQSESPKYAGERDALRATKYAELGGYVSGALCRQYDMIYERAILTELSDDDRTEAETFAELKRNATAEQIGGLEVAIGVIGKTRPDVSRAIDVLTNSKKINDVVSFVAAGKDGNRYVCLVVSPLRDTKEYDSFYSSALASKLSELTQSSPVTTAVKEIEFTAKKGNLGGMIFYKLELMEKDPRVVELLRDAMIERFNQLQPDEFQNAGLRHVGVPVDIELFKYLTKVDAPKIVAPQRREVQVVAVEPATGQLGYTKQSILQEIARYGENHVFDAVEISKLLRVHRTAVCRKFKGVPGVRGSGKLAAYNVPRLALENYVQTHKLTPKGTWREN
jgi:hypothetical protein